MILPRFFIPLAGLLTFHASAADRWWDGGSTDLAGNGNGASAGGAGTWNTSIKNWDPANGQPMAAWNNAANDTANFGGTAGQVDLGAGDLTVGGIKFTIIGSATTPYAIKGNGRNLIVNGTGTTITGKQFSSISGFTDITLGGSQTWTAGTGGSYGIDLTVSGGTVNTDGYTLTLGKSSTGYVAVTSLIAGSGGVTVNGDAIAGAKYHFGNNPLNTYVGTTTVNGAVKIDGTIGNAGEPSVFGAATSTDPSLILLNSGGVMVATTGATNRGMTLTGACGFWAKGTASLTLGGKLTGTGGLSAYGDYLASGKIILAADNDFAGILGTGNDGNLQLAHANAAAKATLNTTLGARASIDLTTHKLAYVIGAITGTGNLNLGTALGGDGNGLVTIGNNDLSTSHTGVLSGTAGLRKAGAGTLTLGGANTYGGATVVDGGVLAVNGTALPDTTRLTINNGKVAATGVELVGTLFFGGVHQASGTWGASGSGAEHIDDVHFTGTAGVVRVLPWAADSQSLDFVRVVVGHSVTLTATITNLGSSPVSGTASTDGAPFSVVSSNWSVAPSSTTTVQVVFSPTAVDAFSGTLTLTGGGVTHTVQLAGEGVDQLPPLPTGSRDYEFSALSGMPAPASSASITLAEGGSTAQTFIPRRDAFLTGYAARDATAPTVIGLGEVAIRTGSYTNSPSTVRFEVFRVNPNNSRTLLGSEDFDQTFFGNTTYSFAFAAPPMLELDVPHELKVTVVTAGNPAYGGSNTLTFFRSSGDYAQGALNTSGDLWCDVVGLALLPVFSELTLASAAGNRFFLDADPANADSSSFQNLPGKLLGVAGEAESIVFTHPADWGPLSFEIDSPGVATSTVTGVTGITDTLTLSGQAEGKRMLWIRAGDSVVGWLKLQAYPRRSMRLSYTYVQFPGESDHALKTMNAPIMAYISSVYDKANVGIQWTDNGTITHEWDLDGDGQSYEEDYSEVWSPLDSGVIPNSLGVFSNVFMLRYDKDDLTIRGNGGGSSRGLGEIPPPANGAHVRGTLNRSAASLGSTLSHEVGHNLGLWHTDITNNLMDVGRAQDNLWTWQWDIVHATLASLPAVVFNPDQNANGILDEWETQAFGNAATGANPADGDPDGDGLDNFLEYALGTPPLQSNASPLIMTMAEVSGERYLRISVPKNPAATNLAFAAELSPDVAAWSGTGVVVEENSTDRFTAQDSVPVGSASRRFIRLKVTVNP